MNGSASDEPTDESPTGPRLPKQSELSASTLTKTLGASSAIQKMLEGLRRNPGFGLEANMAGALGANSAIQKTLESLRRHPGFGLAGNMANLPALQMPTQALSSIADYLDEAPTTLETHEENLSNLFDALIFQLKIARSKLESKLVLESILYLLPLIISFWMYYQSGLDNQAILSAIEYSRTETDRKISDIDLRIRTNHETLEQRFEKFQAQLTDISRDLNRATFYTVLRPTPVSHNKYYYRDVITYLIRNQQVELLERAGEWIRIRAFDFDETQIEGWVQKKYLRRIQ